ncbi:MAG TPA: restriction endonuclease [Candidatus Babeliales bacterium]|nr:restriction endonuclease [Candidatus Babeliales bacterium]
MIRYIRKASGEKEPFDIQKFKHSLLKIGAPEQLITKIVKEIELMPAMRTTRQLYDFALERLQENNPPLAARYNIKRALMELGPTGFPFEQFIALIFKEQGYSTQTDQIGRGACVDHELDIIARKESKHLMIECKFHNRQGIKSDVKVTLYVKARFDDIAKGWNNNPKDTDKFHGAWIVTNTRFTSQAIQYAQCAQIQLLDWSYPVDNNLPHLIKKLQLHPITALTALSRQQKRAFIKNKLILCRDIPHRTELLKKLGFPEHTIKKICEEAAAICEQ